MPERRQETDLDEISTGNEILGNLQHVDYPDVAAFAAYSLMPSQRFSQETTNGLV